MNNIKAGDEVRFLNATGGGHVVRIVDSRMALVAIEDGFEIPVLLSELVVVQKAAPSARQAATDALQKSIIEQQQAEARDLEMSRKSELRRFARHTEQEGCYLAFVPHEQQWLLTGPLDVVLVNHTPVELLYTVHIQTENEWLNADFGQLEPYSKVVIETISRDDLNHWSKGVIQGLPVFDGAMHAMKPLHVHFNIKPSRFYKEGSYLPLAVLGEKALHILLEPFAALNDTAETVVDKAADSPMQPKAPVKEKALIDKHRSAEGEAVVDLHIGELVTNISGLSSHDMFKIQIEYFHKALNSAIMEEYNKVTFIHGVGNGVLRNAIVEALDGFEGLGNRMASMSKFGVGAIEVLIRER
ncbi:MAG TPA: DUF2027 domain-containing protein [Bacteroidales bacterium]|nr:DUF2027 domain-containing protein [Bacteroidales bacterium]